MIDAIYEFLDKIFGPFILNYHPIWVITVAGAIIGGFYNLIYYFFTDIEKQKKLQKLAKEVQKEMMEAQKSGDEKKLRKAQQKQMELMKMQSELMQQQMVPMLLTMPIFWIFFGWLRRWYVEVAIAKAPFNFFVFDFFHRWQHSALPPSELGYLGWYFLTSYAVGMILRKLLDMG
ncbi:EMC3/TMCO1 family protein [Thermococcus sp.]|uniref:EMC3/TMCO1 family protein n=1 Tax=Thermococcus sp. TaxID=35749 RepID=UPI002603BEE2|nr:EMC3/TMCO1 family protein [Thermococcus sp.]